MKKNAMRKNLSQSILKSFGRYVAIIMIIALGASLFIGLLMTRFDMIATGQKYMDEQNMYDLRLVSPYGWDAEHVEQVAQLDGVEDAEGVRYLDAIASLGDLQENTAFRFYSIPEKMSRIALRRGRMPVSPDECLADGYMFTDEILGMQVRISDANEEETLDSLAEKTFTVVGFVASPLYMDMNRGNTAIGNGSLSSFFYVPDDAFDMDYYAEIGVTIPGEYDIYTDAYNQALEDAAERLEPLVSPLLKDRYQSVYNEAMAEYEDGLQEYEDGLKEYEEEKAKALQELEDAHQKLLDAEKEIEENEQLLIRSQDLVHLGWKELDAGQKELEEGWKTYNEAKAKVDVETVKAIEALEAEKQTLTADIAAIDEKLPGLEAQLSALENPMPTDPEVLERIGELDGLIAAEDQSIEEIDSEIGALSDRMDATKAALDLLIENEAPQQMIDQTQQTLDNLTAERGTLEAQKKEHAQVRQNYRNERDALMKTGAEDPDIVAQKQALQSQIDQLRSDRSQKASRLADVQLLLDNSDQTMIEINKALDAAEAELRAGEQQLVDGREQLRQAEKQLKEGKEQLEEAKVEVADGWIEYEDGKAEAEEEFAKAEEDLEEAKLLLDDALDTILSMEEGEVYVLDRNSNVGYGSLDSASNIVAGVSRVLPVFFLLVASLVCITTMTRMIDEERTQIGTLKALGYSNNAIISKYMLYAGSGAVIGCGMGVAAGSTIMPSILWEAYKIMLYITDKMVLEFNWVLCLLVILTYTAVMLLVTWYCCHKTLEEEPAELIRPKAPEAGKKIFLEYLPFWHKISFLNKVTIRNIVRYKQRLAMMLVGIGGCTALLLTGFGLRDSIVNVVDFQFENVTVYDMTVYFSEGQTQEQQDRFTRLTDDCVENVMFFNQISAELEFDHQVKELSLMTADQEIEEFLNFKKGDTRLQMPGVNEVLLTVGVSENLGIQVGDKITMRNADMEKLELTVSGIYDNHVNNYAVIIPQTVEAQWDRTPEEQIALVQVREGMDAYDASTTITGLSDVLNVSISQDLANLVGSMMDALDLVVWVIVFCAGLLAVTVLYNLTNININERIREIATIKVLGFNASETAAYVFKENVSLTVIGAGFGLGLGYLLLVFVMTQIKIDTVWFKAMMLPASYFWSVLLTMLSALVVNFVFYFKLDKINMAEALKSVE